MLLLATLEKFFFTNSIFRFATSARLNTNIDQATRMLVSHILRNPASLDQKRPITRSNITITAEPPGAGLARQNGRNSAGSGCC